MLDVDEQEEQQQQHKFKIKNPRKEFDDGKIHILKEITFDIQKGVIVGIICPSGSETSTLLRALNRLWEPPSSSIFLDGQDICHVDVLSIRRKVAMLFQLPALFEGPTSVAI
ncbi:ABC transporter I family member 17-like [Trifolium medium]|uniref:ABC transporter I family member 17-like n=1 Tax=Trifolium medium TaxID=97028 RepID=A0A392RIS9_9FABA|nr:ABC transporter I family member 17-like [Trifolium medium]